MKSVEDENVRIVIVYTEDTATKNRLGGMQRFQEYDLKESKRGQGYDAPLAWKVPEKILRKYGIWEVMSEKTVMRKRQYQQELNMMPRNDEYGY